MEETFIGRRGWIWRNLGEHSAAKSSSFTTFLAGYDTGKHDVVSRLDLSWGPLTLCSLFLVARGLGPGLLRHTIALHLSCALSCLYICTSEIPNTVDYD
jgi:hypothetical protein